MDPIIAKLNEQAIRKVSENTVGIPAGPATGGSEFQKTFDNTMAERLLDKMRESFDSESQSGIKALSADDVHVVVTDSEVAKDDITSGDRFFDSFKDMNRDLLSLDSALETLSAPGLKLNPRQLLAFQAGIANTTLMAEGFSRFTDTIARGIQTIVQTQVG